MLKCKSCLIVIAALFCVLLNGGVGIILSENPSKSEEMAAKELSEHFELVTGKKYPITRGNAKGGRNIYIGNHPKVAELLKESNSFQSEEWLVQAFGTDTLIITGGNPRGILYGAYEFLENNLGILWLDEWSTFSPKADQIEWSADLKYAGKPYFPVRGVYTARRADDTLRHRFLARNRMNHFHDEKIVAGEAWNRGVRNIVGSPRACHTFYNYTSGWGKDREKLFSWSAGKKKYICATSAYGPGQVCMSNPETIKAFTEQLRKYILSDREIAGKNHAPWIYAISPNDNADYCECSGCKLLLKKYGNQAGVLLSFTNALAQNIENEFPEIKLMTTAYVSTKAMPKGIVPHKNVWIQIALLGKEFSGERRDTHRPFTAPENKESAAIIQDWKEKASLAVWDYWVLYQGREFYPATNALNVAESMRYYKANKVKFVFAECAKETTTSFHALRLFLGMRMMNNPDLQPEKEIIRFINAYYGKAAPFLLEYHNELQKGNSSLNGSLCDLPLNRRSDLNEAFFRKAEYLLSAAEKAEKDNPVILERIHREWIPIYHARLDKRAELPALSGTELRTIAGKLQEYETAVIKKYIFPKRQKDELERLQIYIRGTLADIPPLKGFEDKDVIADIAWPVLSFHRACSTFDDPEAAGGKAIGMIGKEGRSAEAGKRYVENRGISFGVYDFHNRKNLGMGTIPPQALPGDEKYHWYFAGRFNLTEKSFLWMHWSWLIQLQLGKVYDPAGFNNYVDIYVSAKLSGPNFVKGSKNSNRYAIDRVVICRAVNGSDPAMTPLPPELKNRKCVFEVSGVSLEKFQRVNPVFDPESATKTVLRLSSQTAHKGRPLMLGIYDAKQRKVISRIQPKNIPRDEKYHVYSLGVHKIPESGYIFAHVSCLLRVDLRRIYSAGEAGKEYEIVVIVKVEGPSYVNGSVREDAVSLERVLLLKPMK